MDGRENQGSDQENKKSIGEIVLSIPLLWIAVVSVATFVSLFQVTRTPEGLYEVSFSLTWVTVLLLALIWLPILVKGLVISGGVLKALGGEASFVGLKDLLSQLSPEVGSEVLPPLIAATKRAEETATGSEREGLQKLRKDLQAQLAALLEIGARYEEIREKESPGPNRTSKFSKQFAEARERVRDTEMDVETANELFERGSQGDRLVVIALAQETKNPELFPLMIEAIEHPEAAFLQAQALIATQDMLPKLNEEQKRRLVEVINDQRSGGEGKYIIPENKFRWATSEMILTVLRP
jgi:hypothetical protein